jgi:hypothetical protein
MKERAVIRQQMQQQRVVRVAAAEAEASVRLLQYSSSLLVQKLTVLQLQTVVMRAARHALRSVLGAAAMRRMVMQQQLVQVVMCLTVLPTVQQVRSWWTGL